MSLTVLWSLLSFITPPISIFPMECRNLNITSGAWLPCWGSCHIWAGNELLERLLELSKRHWLGYEWVHSMWITLWHIVCQCIGRHLFQQSKCYTSPILQVILSSLQASLPNGLIQMSSALALSMIVQFTDRFGWSMAISSPSYQVGN